MHTFIVVVTSIILVLMIVSAYRMIAGPTVFDRVIGVGVIGTKTIAVLCLLGFLYTRMDLFVDMALAYGLLNFIGTIAIAKLVERQRDVR